MSDAKNPFRKAAIVLVSLDPDVAREMLAGMERDELEGVLREVATLEDVTREEQLEVLREFEELLGKVGDVGGVEKAKLLAESALPKEEARRIVDRLERAAAGGPFAFVERLDASEVLPFLAEEHAQTIAVLLAHLSPRTSARILDALPRERQGEIVRRLAAMKGIEPAAVEAIAEGLRAKLAPLAGTRGVKAGGEEAVAAILASADAGMKRRIIEALSASDPALAERVSERMFRFEDLVQVEDRGIAVVAAEVDRRELVAALAGAPEVLREKFFRNLSPRVVADLKDEIASRGAVPRREVEVARSRVVAAVRRLEAEGRILVLRDHS